MGEPAPKDSGKPKRRFWKKKRWWLLAVLTAGLVWLDGPGWKWIAHRTADHFLPDLGYDASFELEGRLSSGRIEVSAVTVESDSSIKVAALDRLEIGYRLSRVVKGEVASVVLEGLHLEMDLTAAAPPTEPEEPAEPSEPKDPVTLLTEIRQRLVPMNVQLEDLSAIIRRDDEVVFAIEPTSILHDPDSDEFRLDLGAMTLPGDRALSAQTTRIDWLSDRFVLDRLKVLEQAVITPLEAEIADPFQFRLGLELADDRFEIETDLDTASLRLVEGPLTADEVRRLAEIELPLEATVRELDLKAENLSGGLEALTAEARLILDDVDYDDWTGDDLVLKAALAEDSTATVSLTGTAIGSSLTLNAEALLDRTDAFMPTRAEATLKLPDTRPALTHVRDRFTPSEDAPDLPEASLELKATASVFNKGIPEAASASLSLTGGEDLPPISLEAGWLEARTITAALVVPDVEITGRFIPEDMSYKGVASLNSFSPDSLDPWLEPFNIGIPEGITASLTWEGEGNLTDGIHKGDLDAEEARWTRAEGEPPLVARVSGEYDWPESVLLESLKATHADQSIETRIELAERTLALSKLSWSDGDEVLATGSASIPLPEDLADWKALLRETRPITVDLDTPELPLTKLHPFLPEDLRFPEASKAQLKIDLTGTPAQPELALSLRAKSLGLLSKPEIPSADLELDAVGKDQTLKIEGDLLTANYPPAMIQLVTNWDPDQWAEDPETVKAAKLDAELSIANLNLASLATFMPDGATLEGRLSAGVQLGGTVGEPEPQASVTLEGAKFAMKDSKLQPIEKGAARITATEEQVQIENISAEIAGGTVKLGGNVTLKEWVPSNLNLRLDANAIPAARDSSMIVRLNAGLLLSGPWETARLSGNIGVIDSLFFKDIELLPIGRPMTTVAEPSLPAIDAPPPAKLAERIPEPFVNWGLDLGLKTVNPFLIRGNIAKGEVHLDARIGGTVGDPRPSGKASLRDIVTQLPFSTLSVREGEVRLRPDHPFNPVLDIRGTSRVRPYDVTIYIYGPISNPRFQPTSNPPLPETEVMTLIATGTTTSGLEDTGAATARAAQLLLEEARRGRIGSVRMLQPVFNVLDRVDFQVGEADQYTSQKFNSVSIDLNDNWVFTTGISEEGNTRTKVTYLFRFR